MKKIKKVAIIGTGVIGAGWIIRCLAHNKIVYAFDRDLKLKKDLIAEIKRTWPYVKKLFNKKTINLKNFKYFTSIEETLRDADFIQECASENYALKTKLMNIIGKYAKPNAIISSSSSGLLPTRIYSKCKNPERALIGHPFNPVYLLPAVEIVPGKKTTKKFLNRANKFYIMGTFLTFHLAGGKAGMRHMLEQFGPALKLPWTKLKAPKLSNKLINRLVEGTKKQSKGKSVTKISNIRDEYLVELQKLRKKYENKIRK